MIVTGNMILDALDFLKERVKVLEGQFVPSLHRFQDDEEKRDPRELLHEVEQIQSRIARLMEVQAAYNLRVQVTVLGEEISLQRVLQLVAGANRVKNLWTQATEQKPERYHFVNPLARDKEQEYAKPVLTARQVQELSDTATRTAMALKQAIRSGNAREVEMDATPDLFELPA